MHHLGAEQPPLPAERRLILLILSEREWADLPAGATAIRQFLESSGTGSSCVRPSCDRNVGRCPDLAFEATISPFQVQSCGRPTFGLIEQPNGGSDEVDQGWTRAPGRGS